MDKSQKTLCLKKEKSNTKENLSYNSFYMKCKTNWWWQKSGSGCLGSREEKEPEGAQSSFRREWKCSLSGLGSICVDVVNYQNLLNQQYKIYAHYSVLIMLIKTYLQKWLPKHQMKPFRKIISEFWLKDHDSKINLIFVN